MQTARLNSLSKTARRYQASGSYNGVAGRFEWIVDPKLGGVTHRMFVPNGTVNGRFLTIIFSMIIETQLDSVAEKPSTFTKFSVDDPVRPDMAGQYRAFYNLSIDESKVGDFHIFRIKKYLGAIVVSEDVKSRFEAAGVMGAVFESVNGDRITVA